MLYGSSLIWGGDKPIHWSRVGCSTPAMRRAFRVAEASPCKSPIAACMQPFIRLENVDNAMHTHMYVITKHSDLSEERERGILTVKSVQESCEICQSNHPPTSLSGCSSTVSGKDNAEGGLCEDARSSAPRDEEPHGVKNSSATTTTNIKYRASERGLHCSTSEPRLTKLGVP